MNKKRYLFYLIFGLLLYIVIMVRVNFLGVTGFLSTEGRGITKLPMWGILSYFSVLFSYYGYYMFSEKTSKYINRFYGFILLIIIVLRVTRIG